MHQGSATRRWPLAVVMLIAAAGLFLVVGLKPAAGAGTEQFSVSLSDDDSCGLVGADELVIAKGATVTFCYRLVNTEKEPLRIHSIESAAFGTLEIDPDRILDPGESLEHLVSVEDIDKTVSETATWTPLDENEEPFPATATATVMLQPTVAVEFSEPTLTVGDSGTATFTFTNPNDIAVSDINLFVDLGDGALDLTLVPVRDCASSDPANAFALIRFFGQFDQFGIDRIHLPADETCTMTASFVAQGLVTHTLEGDDLAFNIDATPLASADGPRTTLPTPEPAPTISVLEPFGPPTLVGPNGLVEAPPEFRWSRMHAADAYRLWVTDLTNGGKLYDEILDENDGLDCVAGECTVTPAGLSLDEGSSYRWWIRAQSPDGPSAWSDEMNFSVALTPQVPGQVTLIGPTGTGISATPEFVWSEEIHATSYHLQVLSTAGIVLNAVYDIDGDVTCALGQCSITPPGLVLDDDEHAFFVTALSGVGNGPVSEELGFFTGPPAVVPERVAPIAPSGAGVSDTPDFEWTEDTNATHYRLWIQSLTGAGVVHDEIHSVEFDAGCGEGECHLSAFGLTLEEDLYRWWVQAQSPAGNAPWSVPMDFTVGGPPIPGKVILFGPSGDNVQTQTFAWLEDPDASHYRLWIQSRTNGSVVHDVTHSIADDVECDEFGACRVTPAGLALDDDLYRWWIRAQSASGNGPWSDQMDFSIGTQATIPGVVTLLGPQGAGASNTPEFRWEEDNAATHYRLWIQSLDGNGVVHDVVHSVAAEVNCTGGQCSITPTGLVLADGGYRWWIQAQSSAGNGSWSNELDFTTG